MESAQVVIIGGGATGAGLLWDLSLRGISAVLLEKRDLANGATGRCHGLLHSGGRYVVKDTDAARECLAENLTIKQIAPHCVHDVGGLFVCYPQDDPAFFSRWEAACHTVGLPITRLSADETLALEPNLPNTILGSFTCPDAHIDVFQLARSNIEAAVAKGGVFHPYCEVTAIVHGGDQVRAVEYRDGPGGEIRRISCDIVVNAAGGWAQQVAALAGADVSVRCDKGTLLILNHNLVGRVVNRCRPPGDADILVPAGPVCILGTSSMTVPGPEGVAADPQEIAHLMALGQELVPLMTEARILRIFSGVRPLYIPPNVNAAGGRDVSRGFALLDHGATGGPKGFVSIVGGKLTTYRLMAQATADLVASKLGVRVPCRTMEEPLRAPVDDAVAIRARKVMPAQAASLAERRLGPALAEIVTVIEAHPEMGEMICECEQVSRAEMEFVMSERALAPVTTINDLGRRTRLGFGPCQGTFCGYKAMLAGYRSGRWSAEQASAEFKSYIEERWKGQALVPQGKQVEQLYFSHDLFGANYGFYDPEER